MRQWLVDDGIGVRRVVMMIAIVSLAGVGGGDRSTGGCTALSNFRIARADRRAAGSQRSRRQSALTGAALVAQRFR